MITSGANGWLRILSILCPRRARPASSSARSAAGTGTPGGGTGLISAACADARIRNTGSSRFMWKTILLLRIARMPGPLEEFILHSQTDLVGFHTPRDAQAAAAWRP